MNFQPYFEADLAIQIHLITALMALVLGSAILFRKKGGSVHKMLGKVWATVFSITILSSAFISELQTFGRFSAIHLLTVFSAWGLIYALIQIRRGEIDNHKRAMKGLFLGGLIGAGLLSFLPGRLLNNMLFSETIGSSAVGGNSGIIALGVAAAVFLAVFLYERSSQEKIR